MAELARRGNFTRGSEPPTRLHHVWQRGEPEEGLPVMECAREGCGARWRNDQLRPPAQECNLPPLQTRSGFDRKRLS